MNDSKNEGRCIRGLKYTRFMGSFHFRTTTAVIKTLKRAISGSELCIMTELCLIIRGEENILETKGAEISAAARRPGAPSHSQNSAVRFPAASGCTAAGLPESETVRPQAAPGTAGTGHHPEASWLALPCWRRHLW